MSPIAQPNYVYTGPSGDVSAAFPGGVDINANTFSPTNPGTRRQIRWRQTIPNGTVVAGIDASYNGSTGASERLSLFSGPSVGTTGVANLLLTQRDGSIPAKILAQLNGGPSPVALNVIDDTGKSDLIQRAYTKVLTFIGPWTGTASSDKSCNINFPAGYYTCIGVASCFRTSVGLSGIDFYFGGSLALQSMNFANIANVHMPCNANACLLNWPGGDILVQLRNSAPGGVASTSDVSDWGMAIITPSHSVGLN